MRDDRWFVRDRWIRYLDPARDDDERLEAMLDALWNARALRVVLVALPVVFLVVLLWLR